MNSMTACAFIEKNIEGSLYRVEIKGVNSRFLDVYVNLPAAFSHIENEIKTLASSYCKRGKVEICIDIDEARPKFNLLLNESALKAYIEAFKKAQSVAKDAGLKMEDSLDVLCLLKLEGVLEAGSAALAESAECEALKSVCREAFEIFKSGRMREGRDTQKNIMAHLSVIEGALSEIKKHTHEIESLIKSNIKKRFEELRVSKFDESRVLQETALLLMKWTIAEEVSRLESHINAFRREAESGGGQGKKLDFLSQEMGREVNTIGSKTPLVEVSMLVVNMKDAIENIREQVRNVE